MEKGPMNLYNRVLAIGVFDLFHIGHLRYLKYAKSQGQHLLAGVAPDIICHKYKGKWPVIAEDERLEIVNALHFVDETRLIPTSTELTEASVQWISDWHIELVVVGGNWRDSGRWKRLSEGLAVNGVEVIFAPETLGVSSSRIIRKITGTENFTIAPEIDSDE